MGVDPYDPLLKRILKAKNKLGAESMLCRFVDDEKEQFGKTLHDSLIKQFGINAAYFGKAAVDKIWTWFQPPMDFSAQPAVMQGSTVTMGMGQKQEDSNGKVQEKANRNRSGSVRKRRNGTGRRVLLRRGGRR